MGSLAKGELAAWPPPGCKFRKQEKELALTISSDPVGFTVCKHCTSLPHQAEISSWGQLGRGLTHLPTHEHGAITQALFRRKPGLHSDNLLAEINFKTRGFKPLARTKEDRKTSAPFISSCPPSGALLRKLHSVYGQGN